MVAAAAFKILFQLQPIILPVIKNKIYIYCYLIHGKTHPQIPLLLLQFGVRKNMEKFRTNDYTILRISEKPVGSKISHMLSFASVTVISPCLFMIFCAASGTRKPASVRKGDRHLHHGPAAVARCDGQLAAAHHLHALADNGFSVFGCIVPL